ncbi:hypothetical protein [Nitrospira lenta]|uniref:Uncharacterized protein n=1 Tax=Nitrospira lenta TaxID=1436998 RepID=A0A330L2G4_9BACT|nr:hypothetical protein [Nitrospira lenta]SPP63834.1 exported hypothetical protein [Nitrospira lenta]
MFWGLIAGALASVLVVASVHADDSFSSSSLVVFAYSDRPSVSAAIRMEADYVSMPLTIQGDHKDTAKQFNIIAQAKAAIVRMAAASKGIHVHVGPVALSAHPAKKLQSFSSGGYGGMSQAHLHILSPLGSCDKDVFRCATAINEFIKGVRLPDDAKIDFGHMQLAVDNPEQYRDALLKNIAVEMVKTKSALGPTAKVTISGLESPVFVRQADELRVDLFLNYELAMTMVQ